MVNNITLQLQAKTTLVCTMIQLAVKILLYVRLIKPKRGVAMINYASSKGWLLKYKIGNSKRWEPIMFGFDLAAGEDQTVIHQG